MRAAIGQARTEVSAAIGHVPALAGKARDRAGQVAERLPGAIGRVQSSAENTVTRLQKMPDSALRLLAAALYPYNDPGQLPITGGFSQSRSQSQTPKTGSPAVGQTSPKWAAH